MGNVKSTYDGVKQKLDDMSWVKFVSDTMDKFKKK